MKKIFLGLGILFLGIKAHAGPIIWNDTPNSSYTDVASGGTIMFSSCPVQFVGVWIDSPTLIVQSQIVFYRSTSATFTPDITTQTYVNTEARDPYFKSLFDMKNTSYTYINKVGGAKVTYWFKCPKEGNTSILMGPCPGLSASGQISPPLR